MAIVYINGTNAANNADGVVFGLASNNPIGDVRGNADPRKPSGSGELATAIGVTDRGISLMGQKDDESLNRGARNYRVPGLPSGYSTAGVPTYGSGRINTNVSVGRDYSLTPSGTARFLANGTNPQSQRYDQLSS